MTTSSLYTTLPAKATLHPQSFRAHTPDAHLQKFKQLLSLSELGPRTFENTTDDFYCGVTYDWMETAKKEWEGGYDWRQAEARINSFPNYTVDIKDSDDEVYNVHFVALYSDKKDAIPLIFLHGWPGSFLEFLDLLDVVKSQYPTASELPYHIIVPSLPGYGYSSSASLKKNLTMEDSARVLDKLMVGLGFGDGYVAQGGDVGSFLSRMLASTYPSCKAAHLNMCTMASPNGVPADAIDEAEKKGIKRYEEFGSTGNAYAREHGTRPSTISFVLSSSPLGLLAWIAEKFQTWSDVDPPLSAILDSVSLYWFTQSFPRSIYPYRQLRSDIHADPKLRIKAPKAFGYSFFPLDLGPVPKAWAATTGDLVWYKQHEKGGHFAAMELPEVLWADVEDFMKLVWKPEGPKL